MKKKLPKRHRIMRFCENLNSPVKLSSLFVAMLLLLFQYNARAQAQHKFTKSFKDASVEQVFKEIQKESHYRFVFLSENVQSLKKVTQDFKNASIESILDYCLQGSGINYEQDENVFVIFPVNKSKESVMNKVMSKIIEISGKIKDNDGLALPGATIKIKGTLKGTISDENGNYKIKAPSNAILVYSFIGFKTKEIKVNQKTIINVSLEEDQLVLDEVVINAGYYSITERLKTGNITKVTSKELSKAPVADPMAALQARVPGMIITQSSGQPGSSFNIEIRGRTQVDKQNSASSTPLYVIDGVPLANGDQNLNRLNSAMDPYLLNGMSPLYSINVADIESIEILKDADATAIYGSRGANGVILITTKKGTAGDLKFNFSASTGMSVAPLPDMLNTAEYVAMRKEALKNDGLDLETLANSSKLSDRNKVYDLIQYDTLRDDNLVKQLIGGTAHTTDFQASLSGGSELTQFIIGSGYRRETNVYPGDFPNTRASGRFNLTIRSADQKFMGSFSGSYTSTKNTNTQTDLSQYIDLPPNYKLYEDNGELAWNEGGYKSNNPLASMLKKYEVNTAVLNSNVLLSYKIIPELTIKSSLGYNVITTDESLIIPSTAINPLDRTGADGRYIFGHSQFKSWIWEPQIDFKKSFEKSTLTALVGASFQSQQSEGYDISIDEYTDDSFIGSLRNINKDMLQSTSSNFTEYKYQALFGRINYNYDGKYIVNLSGRRDASSRFGPDFRFSNFGAVGGAWIISNEPFMKESSFVSFAKLRASYGVTGNDKIGNYKYQDTYQIASGFSGTATYDGMTALTPASLFKPTLHWEKNIKLEVALDVRILQDRLQFSMAWYRNRSSDPLVTYNLPGITGFSGVVANLEGVLVQNQGVELVISSDNIKTKDFTWSTDFNITFPSNKLVKFPGLEESSYKSRYIIGRSLNLVQLANYLGVNPETGLYMIEDLNDNGKLDITAVDGDLIPQFDTDPDFYGGLQNTLIYKGFRLDFLMQFTKKMGRSWITNFSSFNTPVGVAGTNAPRFVLDRWQNPGDVTEIQKFTSQTSFWDLYKLEGHAPVLSSTFAYTNISYVRLKNVSLSYNLPEKLTKRLGMSSVRIYLQGHNLLTWSLIKGGDPETGFSSILPPWRTIIMGVQISL